MTVSFRSTSTPSVGLPLAKLLLHYKIFQITRYYYALWCRSEPGIRGTDMNHQRFPLVQGGLEIPVEVLVKMPVDVKNLEKIQSARVSELQTEEPVNGSFEDIIDVILQRLGGESSDLETKDDSDESTMGPGIHRSYIII